MTRLEQLREVYDKLGMPLIPWTNRSAGVRRPLITGWQNANPSWATIESWVTKYPLADWALVPKRDLVVVDLDEKNGNSGVNSLFGIGDIGNTMSTTTFSNGMHLYYRTSNTNITTHNFGNGIETKRINASVHIPPSQGYSWDNPGVWKYDDIPMMPQWMEDFFVAGIRNAPRQTYATPRYNGGQRRSKLCSMAGALRNIGLTESELIASLRAIRDARCDTPETFTNTEVDAIAKDYATKEVGTVGLALLDDPLAKSVVAFCERNRK